MKKTSIFLTKTIKKELFYDYMKKNRLNKTKFCKFCEISLPTFDKIMENKVYYNENSLYKMAHAMDIKVEDMFD